LPKGNGKLRFAAWPRPSKIAKIAQAIVGEEKWALQQRRGGDSGLARVRDHAMVPRQSTIATLRADI
jgi:hypothetical protein